MEWVAIDVHIAGDAVTHRLAEKFRLRVAEATGLLTLVFGGMAQHAQDGSLAEISDSQIESWALWHGKRGALATFVREQLCDDDGTVRAWEKYNGAAIREAKASRERMKRYREVRRLARLERDTPENPNGTDDGTPNGTANGTHNNTRTVRPQPDRTRPDRTGQNRTTKSKEHPPRGAAGEGATGEATPTKRAGKPSARKARPTWLTRYNDSWKAKFGGEMPFGQVAEELAPLIAQWGDDEVYRRWLNYIAVATAQYVNPQRFASTWNRWNHATDTTAQSGKPSTAEQMQASMQRLFSGAAATNGATNGGEP